MTETLRWISPGAYLILLRYKKKKIHGKIRMHLYLKKTIGIEFHSLRFIRNGKWLFRNCRWSNSKSNRHCTGIGYTAVIGTEKSKDQTDIAGTNWNILLKLTKTWLKREGKTSQSGWESRRQICAEEIKMPAIKQVCLMLWIAPSWKISVFLSKLSSISNPWPKNFV